MVHFSPQSRRGRRGRNEEDGVGCADFRGRERRSGRNGTWPSWLRLEARCRAGFGHVPWASETSGIDPGASWRKSTFLRAPAVNRSNTEHKIFNDTPRVIAISPTTFPARIADEAEHDRWADTDADSAPSLLPVDAGLGRSQRREPGLELDGTGWNYDYDFWRLSRGSSVHANIEPRHLHGRSHYLRRKREGPI